MQFYEDEVYHAYNRSVNHELLFREPSDYDLFLKKVVEYLGDDIALISYCLMPTHFHLVFQPISDSAELQRSLVNFLISYSKTINAKYKRHGSLFQNKFKAKAITSEDYLSSVINYVHQNPVAAKLCSHPGQWRYSSYNAILSAAPTRVCREDVLEWFGGTDRFIEYHEINKDNHWTDSFHYQTRTA